jgi:diadenosine tetraphosphatase ApaH/serine/threonine PP2A family protein phosphatase
MLMRVVSDVHGNTEGLSAVLGDTPGRKADMTVCLGDVVGYGAEPSACISMVREACDVVVRGNHDSGASGLLPDAHFNEAGAAAIRWTRGVLSPAEREWLGSLPVEAGLEGGLFLCHSDPADPEGWGYMMSPFQAVDACTAREGLTCLVGHTHMACAWTESGGFTDGSSGSTAVWRLLNCGSAGQPRDRNPDAAYMLVDTSEGRWEHLRVPYDIDAAASKIRDAGLPDILWRRLYEGF